MINYYEILGLEDTATQLEIKTAFRQLAKRYHPDKNPLGNEPFSKILKAYETLSDPDAKMRFDYKLDYAKSQKTKTKAKVYDLNKNYEAQELKRRRYYEEHIKKHEKKKNKPQVEIELKQNYNEFKYILFATPLAVMLFLLIVNFASNDRNFESNNQLKTSRDSFDFIKNNANNNSLQVSEMDIAFELFGNGRVDENSEIKIRVQNLMVDDIFLCVYSSKNEFLRKILVKANEERLIQQLPKGNYQLTLCRFSGNRNDIDLSNSLENANYYKKDNWIPSEYSNLLTLSSENRNLFIEITKEEFFSYPKIEL